MLWKICVVKISLKKVDYSRRKVITKIRMEINEVETKREKCYHAMLNSVSLPPMDYSLPGSSAHGIFQARILEWVAISFSRGSSWPKDQSHISCVGRWILYRATREAQKRKIGRINKTKRWDFEKVNKIEKLLARLIQRA